VADEEAPLLLMGGRNDLHFKGKQKQKNNNTFKCHEQLPLVSVGSKNMPYIVNIKKIAKRVKFLPILLHEGFEALSSQR
jgi:hypothetical protein